MTSDFYEAALGRIKWLTVLVALIGTAIMFVEQGARSAVGFLAGSAVSLVNFYLLRGFANAMGGSPKRASVVLIGLRYAIVGVAVYVIVKVLGTAPLAVLVGFLAVFAAVILEILYELILYART